MTKDKKNIIFKTLGIFNILLTHQQNKELTFMQFLNKLFLFNL